MTAVIHHGPPGSYKTFSLVQRVMIDALVKGRVVVTNVRGFNNIDRIRQELNISIPDSASIMYLEPDTNGYELMAKFFHWVPAGAIIVMDEGQRVYPTRDRRFDHLDQPSDIPIYDADNKPLVNIETGELVCRPATLEIAIDQHRHFNWDIYISTTNIGKIHPEIRKAVEWGYRHRDNSGLLPWFKNTWTEFRHDAEQSGKSVSHYSGTPKRYKADHRVFNCYQSTATGATKTSNENISIFRDTKVRFLIVIIVCAFIYLCVSISDAVDRINAKHEEADSVRASRSSASSSMVAHIPNSHDGSRDLNPRSLKDNGHVNPLDGSIINYVGSINDVDLFEVVLADRTLQLTTIDLRNFGYTVKRRVVGSFVELEIAGASVFAFSKAAMLPERSLLASSPQ